MHGGKQFGRRPRRFKPKGTHEEEEEEDHSSHLLRRSGPVGCHREDALRHRLSAAVARDALEDALVVGQAVDDHQLRAAGGAVVRDDEVVALVDVLLVVVPVDVGGRPTGHDARQHHLAAVGRRHRLQLEAERRRLHLVLRHCNGEGRSLILSCLFYCFIAGERGLELIKLLFIIVIIIKFFWITKSAQVRMYGKLLARKSCNYNYYY